jgi:hypothetical protein
MTALEEAKTDTASLYIDLIKRTLTDTIYSEDPLAHFAPFRFRADRARWKNLAISVLERLLRRRQMRIVEALGEHDYPARAHTMIGMRGLENLQYGAAAPASSCVPCSRPTGTSRALSGWPIPSPACRLQIRPTILPMQEIRTTRKRGLASRARPWRETSDRTR